MASSTKQVREREELEQEADAKSRLQEARLKTLNCARVWSKGNRSVASWAQSIPHMREGLLDLYMGRQRLGIIHAAQLRVGRCRDG
mgnify:CR=1 FL=1